MSQGKIVARHVTTGRPVEVSWRDGHIAGIVEVTPAAPVDSWIAPPLVDLQVNGYAGIDFQQDDLTAEALTRAADRLAMSGCTRWLLTLVTDEWPRLMKRLQHVRRLREASPRLQRAITGWHIEGPFLSNEPGYRGAHDASLMTDPSPEHLQQLREITARDPVLLTLAPERAGALAAIELATALGFTVSLGHTNASAQQLRDAVSAGARAFTHLGNACPQALDRHDNILWRVLETPGLSVSLIPDGIHVSPALFRLFHRLWPAEKIFYVSDAMSAAGAKPGRYRLGRLELEVGLDQIVRLPGHPHFAGSALQPIDGIRRAATMLSQPWQECWSRFSSGPAALLGLPSGLETGVPADFCLIRQSENGDAGGVRTFSGGVEIVSAG